jgi:hypothetical protein
MAGLKVALMVLQLAGLLVCMKAVSLVVQKAESLV